MLSNLSGQHSRRLASLYSFILTTELMVKNGETRTMVTSCPLRSDSPLRQPSYVQLTSPSSTQKFIRGTQAITRLILSGVFDRYPNLRILLAHSGGALPQLSSRLASCIDHDPVVASRLKHDARFYLGKLYFDAVAYGSEELGFVSDVVGRAEKFAQAGTSAGASAGAGVEQRKLGSRRMLFGTDHPFFPPLKESDKWKSVVENLEAIDGVHGWSEEDKAGVRGGNALALFGL